MNPFASALIQEDMICHLFCELGLHILISSLRFRLNSPPPHLGGLRNRFLRAICVVFGLWIPLASDG